MIKALDYAAIIVYTLKHFYPQIYQNLIQRQLLRYSKSCCANKRFISINHISFS